MEKRKITFEVEIDVVDLLAEEESCMIAGTRLHNVSNSECDQDEDKAVEKLGKRILKDIIDKVGIDPTKIELKTEHYSL